LKSKSYARRDRPTIRKVLTIIHPQIAVDISLGGAYTFIL